MDCCEVKGLEVFEMRNTLVSLGMTLCLVTGCSVGVADPNIQVTGTDDGTPNCGPFPELFFSRLYIGGPVGSSTAIDESFHAPPTATFCNANIGFSSETYGPEGVRLAIPRTEDGPFHNNAELLAIPAFEPGQRMV